VLLVLLLSRTGKGRLSEAAFPRLPLLAPWYRVVGDGDRLLLEHGGSLVVLEGAAVRVLLPALLPLLDGTRTVDDLAQRLGVAARPAIEHALATLAEHEALVEGPDAPRERREAAHAVAGVYGLAPADAAARLEAATIGVVGRSPAGADVSRLLRLAGVEGVRQISWRASTDLDLVVVVPAVDELDLVAAWNRRAHERSIRWLLLRPFDGRFAIVGPLVVPGESACHECVLRRRGANLGFGDSIFDVESAPTSAVAPATIGAFLAALAADVALRWSVGHDTTLPGILHIVEAHPELALTRHLVLRVPRCTVCSPVESSPGRLPWHEALPA
jgi:bacteriocin biosynthesis cyclodehydratase domain-containing protein